VAGASRRVNTGRFIFTLRIQSDAAYTRYLTSIGNAVDAFRKGSKVFVVMVATERLDADACHRISDQLGGVPVLTSDDYDMYQLVSILRACHLMVPRASTASSPRWRVWCRQPALPWTNVSAIS